MHLNKENILFFNNITIALISFTISILSYYWGYNNVSSIILILSSIFLVYLNKKEYGYYTNPVSVFSGIWLFSIGLATLRLHPVQTEWKFAAWVCLVVAFVFFIVGYNTLKNFKFNFKKNNDFDNNKKANLILILIVFSCSLISIIIECFICEIPLFSKDMFAYMNFGVFGLRYFGVLSALVLPLSCLYVAKFKKQISKKEFIMLIIINVIMFCIPFLIVSRGLVLEMLFFTLFTLCSIYKKKEILVIPIILLIILFSWKSIGSLKNMDDTFLNEALKMNILDKKEDIKTDIAEKKETPIINIKNVKLMRTYMYFALNYDNFNLNVNEINYTYGKSCFFPVYVMTGLKFVTQMKDPRNKLKKIIRRYNTYSILFLPYMDFGIFGVAVFMFIMGFLSFFFESIYPNIIFNSILKFCLLFSFFSPYLIYPTTFLFYIVFLIVGKKISFWTMNKYLN